MLWATIDGDGDDDGDDDGDGGGGGGAVAMAMAMAMAIDGGSMRSESGSREGDSLEGESV